MNTITGVLLSCEEEACVPFACMWQSVLSFAMWVLGIEVGSPGLAAGPVYQLSCLSAWFPCLCTKTAASHLVVVSHILIHVPP